jgi:hypothetical protein
MIVVKAQENEKAIIQSENQRTGKEKTQKRAWQAGVMNPSKGATPQRHKRNEVIGTRDLSSSRVQLQ